jgi:ribonuclease HII
MNEKELDRLNSMLELENRLYLKGYKNICGVDEAGRGPLCGPVVAAAVILEKDVHIEGVNDSKKLSEKKREIIFELIKEKAIAIGIGICDVDVIEEINILNATKIAMKKAIEQLKIKPDYVLIDGNQMIDIDIEGETVVAGDSKSQSIAAASIIAKVTRDKLLYEYDKIYPEYNFSKHKGYGTKIHREAILKYGLCPIHRPSFCKNILNGGKCK